MGSRFFVPLNDPLFSDVKLICGGITLYAHKVLLVSSGGVFFKTLYENPYVGNLVLSHLNALDMFDILTMLYLGKAKVDPHRRDSFLFSVKDLQLTEVYEVIEGREVEVDMESIPVSLNFVYSTNVCYIL